MQGGIDGTIRKKPGSAINGALKRQRREVIWVGLLEVGEIPGHFEIRTTRLSLSQQSRFTYLSLCSPWNMQLLCGATVACDVKEN